MFKIVECITSFIGDSLNANLWGDFDYNCQIRLRGKMVHVYYVFGIAAGGALVGSSREKVAVTNDNVTCCQGRTNEGVDVVAPIFNKQVELLVRRYRAAIFIERPDLPTVFALCRFPGLYNIVAETAECFSEPFYLSGFAGTVDSLCTLKGLQQPSKISHGN